MEIITDQRFRRTIKYLRAILIMGCLVLGSVLLLYSSILIYAKILGPPPLAVPQSTIFFSDDGKTIGESHNGQKRYWVSLNNISPEVVQATLAVEDKNFYTHNGFDYKRIAGAALADIRALSKVQGASTISQQYARNLFLEHEKTWKRKLLEAFYTIRIEMSYTKDEIIEGYLNTIYYGEGAYGIQAASKLYFDKDATKLTLAEASMLAGIPKGPSYYSPLASWDRAKERQRLILSMMEKQNLISSAQNRSALKEELELNRDYTVSLPKVAPYFQDAVKSALKNALHLDDRTIELGGLRVYTTLNTEQQAIAESQIERLIAKDSDIQVGFVAMNPKNGHVKAMVGGRNYEQSPFNRATQAIRHPGSTMKPLLYYAAIEQGFTPATTMRSELTTFRFDDNQPEYTPHNYNNKYAEKDITMAQALALSDNVYAVKTHLFLGEDVLVETAKKFGLSTVMKKVPSLALGTSGVRVLEMANAYSLFANGGKKVLPVLITRVENVHGEVLYEYKGKHEPVLRPDVAYVTTHMMTGMFDRKLNGYTSVTGSSIVNDISRNYAGKSGSTDADSWMIGFSPQMVTAVWTGFDQGKPIESVAEKGYARNIWIHFMENALKEEPIKFFKAPKGTVSAYINPENGKLATNDCPVRRLTYFVTGTEPTQYCTEHIKDEKTQHTKQVKKPKKKKPWYKKWWQRH